MQLFGGKDGSLPLWFKKRDWDVGVECKLTTFLPPELGLVGIGHKGFRVKVSSPARAVRERLYLAPKSQPLLEVFELMECSKIAGRLYFCENKTPVFVLDG